MIKLAGFFLLAGACLLWIVGGNVVVARSFKRRGLPMETGFQPFGLLRAEVNLKEGAAILALMALCLGLAALGGLLMDR